MVPQMGRYAVDGGALRGHHPAVLNPPLRKEVWVRTPPRAHRSHWVMRNHSRVVPTTCGRPVGLFIVHGPRGAAGATGPSMPRRFRHLDRRVAGAATPL